jgi:hypothetical protein
MAKAAVTPIQEHDLPEVGRFLHDNLNRRFTAEAWIGSLTHPWCESRPNFGMQLRDGTQLVGVLCATYSDQHIGGRIEKFCNPHSWCVLDSHRNDGISLVLAMIRQRGYHFTMLTPNPNVAQIFRHLKFKDLAAGIVVFANRPALGALLPGRIIEADLQRIPALCSAEVRRDFELHRDIPWLRFLAFGVPGDVCLVVYKTMVWKRLPSARILHISDPDAFMRHRSLLQHRLLLHDRLVFSYVESRFLRAVPRLAWHETRTQGKLFSSPTLQDEQILEIYTELMSLDV